MRLWKLAHFLGLDALLDLIMDDLKKLTKHYLLTCQDARRDSGSLEGSSEPDDLASGVRFLYTDKNDSLRKAFQPYILRAAVTGAHMLGQNPTVRLPFAHLQLPEFATHCTLEFVYENRDLSAPDRVFPLPACIECFDEPSACTSCRVPVSFARRGECRACWRRGYLGGMKPAGAGQQDAPGIYCAVCYPVDPCIAFAADRLPGPRA